MRYRVSRWLILPLFALALTVQAEETTLVTHESEADVVKQTESLVKPVPKLKGTQLIKALRKGGYVVFMRHAISEVQEDAYEVDLENCDTQRNLSKKGKVQAKMIGSAIQKLAIPIGDVYSSPYCRCVETAKLAFSQVEAHEALIYAAAIDSEEKRSEYADELKQMLSAPPSEADKNTVIISHSVNLQAATGILPKPEGVLYVFEPTEEGYNHVGTIKPSFWDIFLLTAP